MKKEYDIWIPPAQPMTPMGKYEWVAKAKVKQTGTGRSDDIITLDGEWYGETAQEAEDKARRAAGKWISEQDS